MKHSNLTTVTKAGRTKHPATTKKGFATAKRSTNLKALFKAARKDVTKVNKKVCSLLDGQDVLGGKALVSAYRFTIACIERPAEAAKLPGWQDIKCQANANPYCRPLKFLAGDMDKSIQSKITVWAKVFVHAHAEGITPEQFLEHRKRNHGMRRWYDFINASGSTTAGNDNHPGKAPRKSGATSGISKRGHIDMAQRLTSASSVAVVVIDKAVLMNDAAAKARLESNPAFVGIVKASDKKCRAFAKDNDARFTITKGAA